MPEKQILTLKLNLGKFQIFKLAIKPVFCFYYFYHSELLAVSGMVSSTAGSGSGSDLGSKISRF